MSYPSADLPGVSPRHVMCSASRLFLPGSALSDGTSSCSPLSLSRTARLPCEPCARCDREIIVLPTSATGELSDKSVSLFSSTFLLLIDNISVIGIEKKRVLAIRPVLYKKS